MLAGAAMETSIRFVRVGGLPIKPALCFRGRKTCHAVINDDNRIRVLSDLTLKSHDSAVPVLFEHQSYPIARFVERFREIASRKGITKRAEFLLSKALEGGVDEDAELPPDETDDEPGSAPVTARPAAPAARPPGKPAKPVSGPVRKPVAAPRTPGGTLVARLATEMKLEPPKLRKLLRSKGLNAPYDDEAKLRKTLGLK